MHSYIECEDLEKAGLPQYVGASMAAGALQFGTVQEYDRILDERYEELVNSPYWDVYITRAPYVPMFYHDDDSSRQAIADYYRKNVIIAE